MKKLRFIGFLSVSLCFIVLSCTTTSPQTKPEKINNITTRGTEVTPGKLAQDQFLSVTQNRENQQNLSTSN